MKNQYFGDVNDYRKYGLLRCIVEATGLAVGVLWLLTRDDGRTDGEFRAYLSDGRWRRHDVPLHVALAKLLEPGVTRDVGHASNWDLIPGATYFDRVFTDQASDRDGAFTEGMVHLASCPIVFLDPDNGIEVKSVPYGRHCSSRYVYWSELTALYQRGHSLLIYQHYPRERRDAFETRKRSDLRACLRGANVSVFSTPHVVFFLALQPSHSESLPSIEALVTSAWAGQIQAR